MPILALGSINVDLQMKVDRWPEAGESLHGRDFVMAGGGKAANVALLACRAGVPAMLLGQVGNDAFADVALAEIERAGVDLAHVRRTESSTGIAFVIARPGGDKTILMAGNANMAWDEDATQAALAAVAGAGAGSVLVADLEVPAQVVETVAEAARARGMSLVIDPSPAGCMTDRLYELADVLTPNAAEARHLSGEDVETPELAFRAGRKLRERAPGAALMIKLSGGDCVLLDDTHAVHLQGVPVEAVDSTGAGDAFAAAVAIGLQQRKPLVECALLGMAASSIAVERYGAQASYADGAALQARFRELSERNKER